MPFRGPGETLDLRLAGHTYESAASNTGPITQIVQIEGGGTNTVFLNHSSDPRPLAEIIGKPFSPSASASIPSGLSQNCCLGHE